MSYLLSQMLDGGETDTVLILLFSFSICFLVVVVIFIMYFCQADVAAHHYIFQSIFNQLLTIQLHFGKVLGFQ